MNRRLSRKIKFYCENKSKVNLTSRDLQLKGTIVSLPTIFRPYFDFKLEDNQLMQIYMDDLYPDSIYPVSNSIQLNDETKKNLRKNIPSSLKKDLWANFFGEEYKGKCQACKKEILRDGFEAGHKTSVANGGSNALTNLVPLCIDCNRSMGSDNFNDFVQTYYSN